MFYNKNIKNQRRNKKCQEKNKKIKEKEKKTRFKSIKTKQTGITLIALVVTIVILLILASVSISLVLGNNGLISKAKEAVNAYEQDQINTEIAMNSLSDQLASYLNVIGGSGENENPEQPENPDIPTPPSLPSTEGSIPYLPSEEFIQLSGTDLETGLVIQDDEGNQYVWIEVPNDGTGPDYSEVASSTDYTNIESALKAYTSVYRGTTTYDDVYYSDAITGLTQSQYNELKQTMLKSVYENGGFYIGRYETGITDTYRTVVGEATETPVIQANAYPYTYVTCSQAQALASSMNSGAYTSSLMFGVQWDLVLKYLETKGASQEELNTNSINWGNCRDATYTITNANAKYSVDEGVTWRSAPYNKTEAGYVLLTTGADEGRNSKQNIYDLAGNVSEWTLEYTYNISSPCASRGGDYYSYGSDGPASHRYNDTTIFSSNNCGLRVALY